MGLSRQIPIRSSLVLIPAIILTFTVSITKAQTKSSPSAQDEVATVSQPSASNAAASNVPVFTDYRGVRIGMPADEVRAKVDRLKKGEGQDFLVFSERESAQFYYDKSGKVTAISIDYFDSSSAPSPEAVLGVELQAKADGSMYQLNRYPEAGYWVSYNRTAGDKPIVTITMQKM
jgi:FlaG/FlaF family flagellin (archaellin)